ncbi:sensor histidine kinase [Catalinimonas niigatensis]|uniref:sensor histidine kinase n=1 Tax=Catalinimonas niigatensis TaxID=1397264 RepID=UPI00266630E5|nr:ATP-binding protein [Catalinimonas niigatensis]WPP51209.1 ATP-binding protein [Catalinimonas niigatensis]
MKISKPLITYSLVLIISILLLFHFFLTSRNTNIIDKNTEIKKEAEIIKVKTGDIIRALHLMDLGIRGYALLPNQANLGAYDSAIYYLESTFVYLEDALAPQQFPMEDFYSFKDSVYAYVNLGELMLEHLQQGNREQFMEIYQYDYGYGTWLHYLQFSSQIEAYENAIFERADSRYKNALARNTNVFIVILLLVLPTLFYTAYQANQSYKISERLRVSEQQKNDILGTQNITLEKLVKERTEEIETQNEEIIAQNEELSEANLIIEQQNRVITDRNEYLKDEVEKQTQGLVRANSELIQRVAKMEQYAFIISHNLRSPVAQIMGLSSILKQTNNPQDIDEILPYIEKASKRLDTVLKELNHILIIENEPNRQTSTIDLQICIEDVIFTLRDEIKASGAQISLSLEVQKIESVQPYIHSIFYNLLSNAIKYRDPTRDSTINISSVRNDDKILIKVLDNGLGIDMKKYSHDIFNLYRRFHTHVEGRGIGLYLTKIQVEILRGTIAVESKPGDGSTFLINLPARG